MVYTLGKVGPVVKMAFFFLSPLSCQSNSLKWVPAEPVVVWAPEVPPRPLCMLVHENSHPCKVPGRAKYQRKV